MEYRLFIPEGFRYKDMKLSPINAKEKVVVYFAALDLQVGTSGIVVDFPAENDFDAKELANKIAKIIVHNQQTLGGKHTMGLDIYTKKEKERIRKQIEDLFL